MLCPLFPLLLTSGQTLDIFFFLLQNLHSSSSRRWLGDFVQKTRSSICKVGHITDQVLMLHLRFLRLILLLRFMRPVVPSQHCVLPFCVEPRIFYIQQPAAH